MAIRTAAPRRHSEPEPRDDRVSVAARHLYDAECALHIAHQTQVDAWIAAANDKLHQALTAHLAAVTDVAQKELCRG